MRPIAHRIAQIAELLSTTDALRVRIKRDGEELEVGRSRHTHALLTAEALQSDAVVVELPPRKIDAITAELVGIFHLGRPAPVEGELIDEDRELAYIEALGIRNPVRSLGPGRIVGIAAPDGAPVEYGQSLFMLDRG
jgi:biotin carboxyl carrier protein